MFRDECVSCREPWEVHNRCRLRACKRQYGEWYGFIFIKENK